MRSSTAPCVLTRDIITDEQAAAAPPPRPVTPVEVRGLTSRDHAAWDDFVMRHPMGSPFHLMAWHDTIRATFGYQPLYRLAVNEQGICGVLPLFLISNLIQGRVLLSSPFAVYGGVLATSEEARQSLKADVEQLGHRLKADYAELRNGYAEQSLGYHRLSRYVTFTQPLAGGEEQILQAIPRKTRAVVRKTLRMDYSCIRRHEPTSAFLDVYLDNIQRLGTPAFPRRLFQELFRNFGNMIDIREYVLNGAVASAVLTFYFRDQVLPYYGASNPDMRQFSPSNYMYFDLMRWAAAEGYRHFDFGRSKKGVSGSYDFKAHWGMVETELPYEILLLRRKELPNFTPANPKFSLAGKIWSSLPSGVARALGPSLVRLFP